MSFKVKNFEINDLIEFLMKEKMVGKKSRHRTRLCKILIEKLSQIDEERLQLITEFSEKDGEGKPIVYREDDVDKAKIADIDSFNKELVSLYDEIFIIEKTEENSEMLDTVKDIILNSEQEFSMDSALLYDRWCQMVEEM